MSRETYLKHLFYLQQWGILPRLKGVGCLENDTSEGELRVHGGNDHGLRSSGANEHKVSRYQY